MEELFRIQSSQPGQERQKMLQQLKIFSLRELKLTQMPHLESMKVDLDQLNLSLSKTTNIENRRATKYDESSLYFHPEFVFSLNHNPELF